MSTEVVKSKPVEDGGRTVREEFVRPRFRTIPGEDAYRMEVVMPGVARGGIDISLVGDSLTIVGCRARRIPDDWRPVFRELSEHGYRLRVRLNIQVAEEGITAHMEDGVLTLTLPILGEAKPRHIEIT